MELQYYCDLPDRDLTIPDASSVTWCDIEPGCFQKAQDVRDFGTLVTSLGFRYGTYGNKTSISAVFGDSEELAQWPLWYADYRDPDYATFVPFNGFTAPVLWQWSTTGWWTPAGVINADVSITPDGRVFLDISNFTTLSIAQADYIKYRVAGVVIGLQDPGSGTTSEEVTLMSWLNDTTRAALMLVITNAFSVAVLFGLHVSAEQVAGATSFINSAVILLMLVVKSGQSS